MENTVKLLDLTLTKVATELENKNFNATKTLMNTYRNLLQRFLRTPYANKKLEDYKEPLKIQKERLNKLFLEAEKSLFLSLNNSEYKDGDTLSMILERIELTTNQIEDMFKGILSFNGNKS